MRGLVSVTNPSMNAKLGDCATTHAAQVSCPSSCVFKDGGGCYAETGRQGKFVTGPLNQVANEQGATANQVAMAEVEAIDQMDVVPGRPLRLHTVGDCSTPGIATLVADAAERYMERGGGQVFTYTHAWREVPRSAWGKVSVLASCENPVDVRAARRRGYATALVVPEFEHDRLYAHSFSSTTDIGDWAAIVPCPAMTRARSCSTCRLCFDDAGIRKRGYSIGFAVHGIPLAQRRAKLALANPDDPLRKVDTLEQIRAVRDKFLLWEDREPTIREVVQIVGINSASAGEWLRYLRGEIVHPAERRRAARATGREHVRAGD